MIKNLLTSGYDFNDNEYEQKLKYILFNSLLIFNIILVGIATIIRFVNTQYDLGFYDFIYVSIGILIFFLARRSKLYFVNLCYGVIVLSLLIVSLTFNSGLNPIAGISWYLILLMNTIFLLGEKEGGIVFITSTVLISYISIDKYAYTYTEVFLGMMPFVVMAVFIHFFQKRNQDVKSRLNIANEALKNHNAELNNLIQNSSSELYIFDSSSYKFLYANRGALNNIGYSLEELCMLKLDVVNPSMTHKQISKIKEELELNNEAFRITKIYRKDGSVYPIYANVHTINYKGTDAFAIFVSDISELRNAHLKLDKSKHEVLKLTQILDKSPVSIIITDVDGNIEYSNPWFSKLTGYTKEEVKGQNPRVLKSKLHSDEQYEKLWDDITHDKIWNGTFKNITKDGKEYWESAIIAPINNEAGELSHYIAIKQEITQQVYLKELVAKKNKEKIENFEKTLESFVKIVEERDTYTAGHSQRVAKYSNLIAKYMGFSDEKCELIYRAGILHDIGKIATPDNVLLKPGKLSDLEYTLIKEHVNTSYEILAGIPMYKEIADIIAHHHERYDGLGYPGALKGDEISMLSHIMIVADAFDAMTTNRIYKGRKDMAEALEELETCSGTQFHPKVVRYAKKALLSISLEDTISQLPTTDLEKERFSYFYRDQVTDTYNADYLRFVLNQNQFSKEFACVNVVYMHNFSKYNNHYGWAEGDKLLIKFADYLVSKFPSSQIFRIYGDDFVIINKEHVDIDMEQFKNLEMLLEDNIYITHSHSDLRVKSIVDLEEFEKM